MDFPNRNKVIVALTYPSTSTQLRNSMSNAVLMASNELYIRWSQSERVAILVGLPEDGNVASRRFTLPMDLLKRRSKRFQITLDDRFFDSATGMIQAPETSIATFRRFYIWALSSAPQIDPTASLEEVVDLAIFATIYQVIALQNQAVGRIRACLSSGDWQLQPDVVKRIYEHVGETSTLRQMVRVGLGTINQPMMPSLFGYTSSLPANDFIQSWRELFGVMGGDLSADYFEATQRKWGRDELQKGGPCRFHEHGKQRVLQSDPTCDNDVMGSAVCSFAESECFSDEVEPPTLDEPVVLSMRERKKMKRARMRAREEVEANKGEPISAEHLVGDNEITGGWSRVSDPGSD